MANKYCTKKENCVHGNVLQDYKNFYRDTTARDGHEGECKDCMAQRRKERREKNKTMFDDQFALFIG